MPEPFDFDAAFDEDYLYFYAPYLTTEQDDADTALIVNLLELRRDDQVLDLACGHGRVAARLAASGCRVTGLDRSALFLAKARELAAERGVDVRWVEDDVRRLSMLEEFDAVVHWFTSFGYFDDATNRDVLRRVLQALVPGGRFLVETTNVFHAAFDPDAWQVKRVGDDMMIDRKSYDATTGRQSYQRTVVRAGRPQRTFDFSVRLLTAPELRGWLEAAGFVDVRAFGGDGEEFHIMSDRLIVTARRPS